VDLTPGKAQATRPSDTARNTEELRFAVAAMVSAEATFSTYKRLVQRICRDIDLREVFLISPSYAAVRNDIERGDLDVAFVCTGTYVHARRAGRLKLLVRPEFLGEALGIISREHGGIHAYLERELDFGQDKRERLRSLLAE
jgi:phosphonate transport system substrate-binding protein